MSLEEDLQRHLHGPRIAHELCLWLVEAGILRSQYVDLGAGELDWSNVVKASSNPLRMVENIERLDAEFDPEAFREGDSLQRGHVDVVNRRQLQRVAARIGQSAESSLDILRIRVGQHAGYGRPACAVRNNRTAAVR